jgi:toxin-antitoxin system PIN domain toxin
MMLPDNNVWFALALSTHTFHARAGAWLAQQADEEAICFCRATQQSFLRLLTTSAAMAPYGLSALSNATAWSLYEQFLADRRITWLAEPRRFDATWKKLAATARPSPKLWMDAYLAAFAISGHHQLVTTDKAFKQFKGLDLLLLSA